ncbi:MAG TPA: hypothetical protein PL125_01285 [Candidatus Omnitrophota bacterium]|nr:hypothetical protein [Candidatus Omnitrophota bacterium]HPT38820.1 hypothetical protein [Candidatus Omnitrophota bacterium]
MNKEAIKNLAFILLLGIAAFSMVRYVSELKARFRLQDSLTRSQGEVVALTQEKQNLLQEIGKEKELNAALAVKNLKLKANLKASQIRLKRLFRDSSQTQSELEDTSAKFAVLKAENRALIDIHKRIYVENEQFKFRLGSLQELKKAIKELKAKKRNASDSGIKGNQGFLIKDGNPTSGTIRIEVNPAKTKE